MRSPRHQFHAGLEADRRSIRLHEARGRRDDETAREVCDLGRGLLATADAPSPSGPRPPRDGHPEVLLRGLEGSAEGCRWLLDRWAELKHTDARSVPWDDADMYRFVRLQGKQPADATHDPGLNLLFLAWDAIEPDAAADFWRRCRAMTPCGPGGSAPWRALVDRPATQEEAIAVLVGVIDGRMERLEEMLGLYEEVAGEEAAGAWFDPGPEAEGVRRRRSTLTRELRQLLELILKMQAARAKRAARDEPRRRGGRGEEKGRPEGIRETSTTEGTVGEEPGNGQGANEADPEDRGAGAAGDEGEAGPAAEDTGPTGGDDERSREAAAGGEGRPGAAGPRDRQRGGPTAASRKGLVKGDGDETGTADGSPKRTDEAKMGMLRALVRQRLTEIPGDPAADNRSQSDGGRRSDQGGDREESAGGRYPDAGGETE